MYVRDVDKRGGYFIPSGKREVEMIPVRLQCAYCIRNHTHGGECQRPKFDDIGCLAFKADPKGCIRHENTRIRVPLFYKLPPLHTWDNNWTIGGVDTEISIVHIYGIDWDKKKCQLIIHCRCEYYINEYHEDYKQPSTKPKLELVR